MRCFGMKGLSCQTYGANPPGYANYFAPSSPAFPGASATKISLNYTALRYGEATGMW